MLDNLFNLSSFCIFMMKFRMLLIRSLLRIMSYNAVEVFNTVLSA